MGASNQLAATRLDRLARSTRDVLPRAVLEPMHSAAQEITGCDVCFDGWPRIVRGKFDIESRSLHDRQWLPRLEAEPRVKAVGEQQRDGNAELLGLI